METIIYIPIAAVICGAQSWNEIEEFGNAKIAFFKSRIPSLEFIPSHDTFNRFFSMIKPDYFELIFRNWVKQVCQEVKGVVAIDGKLMRGPSQCDGEHTRGKEGFKLWMVSAWSSANGISLGQVKVDDKSNEITAIPLLINSLELSGCIVTIDAMGCQKDITQTIIGHDANYINAIKENKKKNYQPAKQIIDDYQDRDEIIRSSVKKFASEFIDRRIRLEYDSVDIQAVTDEKWFAFVVEQLLSNALKYTREGSIKIYSEGKVLCIKDTGIGIAPEDLPRVFDKGYTGCNGRTDRRASGLGLYLCRRICQNLGIDISISSTVGEGTTVRLDLSQYKLRKE